jgi:two-component system LytT family response regulator
MTRVWRAVIADDEPLARRVIRDLLATESDVAVVAEARSGRDAVDAIRSTKPDLLFIDIAMPELDGFAVLEAIPPAMRPHSIFVTAYDEFAVRAFEQEALDYLVKPFTDDRFRKTLGRARRHLARAQDPVTSGPAAQLERLPVTVGRRTRWVDLADVTWIEADDYYARLHTRDAVHLVRITMADLERRLDPDGFVRVHRGALVNRRAVQCITRETSGGHALVLTTGVRVKVGGRRVREVTTWLTRRTDRS